MEDYIKSTKYKPITTKNEKYKSLTLGTANWEEFCLNDLFDIKAGIYHYPNEYEEGRTPYISASNVNNGIAQRISLKPEFDGNCIVSGKIGCTAFYQIENFCATGDVNIFTPKRFKLNQYIGLFFVSIINKSENYKWAYGRQCRVGDSKEIVIKLPIKRDVNGKPIIDVNKYFSPKGYIPDLEYMENYIKSLPYGDRI